LSICPHCNHEISEAARFCPECGMAVSLPTPNLVAAAAPRAATAPAREKHLTVSVIAANLPDNIAGMLAYFILPAIVFLLIRPFNRNRFVRFHSIQCLLTIAVLMVVQFALALFGKVMPLLILSLYGLLGLAELTLWLLLLFKAYGHEMFKLPFVGDVAERWAERK
jgi:uncharacterized membrane protein